VGAVRLSYMCEKEMARKVFGGKILESGEGKTRSTSGES